MIIKTDNAYLELTLKNYIDINIGDDSVIYIITSPILPSLFSFKGLHVATDIYAHVNVIRVLSGLDLYKECNFYDLDSYADIERLTLSLRMIGQEKKKSALYFNDSECRVMNLSCKYLPVSIARQMNVTNKVIYRKISKIKQKLGVKSNIEYLTACILKRNAKLMMTKV
ncbi:hypothetical protein MXF09_23475 [Klebsiella aerogenes]|uniref:hypothetical protein n=1 Tax=Klebsiella aerogenes TaxID=548 RepID=UPI002DBDC1AA|nr:hypothetical protein [Klebsiella aerogenes]MEB5742657.1 hypothetical protein [Klebsiella aerogenes]